jgi:hypothetical protein
MKKIFSIITVLFVWQLSFTQTLYIYKKGETNPDKYDISKIDSITFSTFSIPTDNLVAYYPFNGNANDESGNGYDGTIIGATFENDKFSSQNKALYFSGGSSAYVTTSNTQNIVLNDTFSICFWIKFEQAGKIIDRDKIGTTTTDWNIGATTSGSVGLELGTSTGVYSNGKVNDNAWHYLVFLRNRSVGTIKIYIDGVLDQQQGDWLNDLTGNAQINFGAWDIPGGFNDGFTGTLDEIRFYNRELSTNEIQAFFHEGGW